MGRRILRDIRRYRDDTHRRNRDRHEDRRRRRDDIRRRRNVRFDNRCCFRKNLRVCLKVQQKIKLHKCEKIYNFLINYHRAILRRVPTLWNLRPRDRRVLGNRRLYRRALDVRIPSEQLVHLNLGGLNGETSLKK